MKKFLLASIAAAAIFALSPQSYAAQTHAKPTASAPSKPATATKPQVAKGQHGTAKPVIGQAGHGVERKGVVAHGRDVKGGRDERFARNDRAVRDDRFHGGEFHRDVRAPEPRHEELRRDRDHREFFKQ